MSELMSSSNIHSPVNIFCIPSEVLTKILIQCDVIDILSFCCTNKLLNHVIDNTYFWKQKWKTIVSSTKFTLPKISCGSLSQYKSACIRYHVVFAGKETDEYVFPSCKCCSSLNCKFGCPENWKPKFVVDMGSKTTRIFNALTRKVKSYSSIYRIQDKFFRHGNHGGYLMNGGDDGQMCKFEGAPPVGRGVNDDMDFVNNHLMRDRAFCVICSTIHYLNSPCVTEKSKVHNFNCENFKNDFCRSHQKNSSSSCHLFSPGLGIRNPVGFPFLVANYLRNIFMIYFCDSSPSLGLRRPGSTFVICVPDSGCPPNVCRSVLNFLFVEMKVGRVCLIPKALALAKSESASCCISVHSGAFFTSVAVVVDEKVVAVKDIPLGGWHLSKELHSSLVMRGCISSAASATGCIHQGGHGSSGPPVVPVVSFEDRLVKTICSVPPFLHRSPTLSDLRTAAFLKTACHHNECSQEIIQVFLRNEFSTGPEIHFAALDLHHIIYDLIQGLPYSLKVQCLSKILLTGGNSSLNGLVTRLEHELRSLLPNFHDDINVCLPFGPSDLHTVIGASAMEYNYNRHLYYADDKEFQLYCDYQEENNSDKPFWLQKEDPGDEEECSGLSRNHHQGEPYWLTRDEFIAYGPGF